MEMVKQNKKQLILVAGVLLILLCLSITILPPQVDWRGSFRPAICKIWQGGSPYDVHGFMMPPWAVLPLFPLALLPTDVGAGVLALVGIVAYAYVAHQMGANKVTLALFLLSPTVLYCLINGNIDWLVLLGLVLPIPTSARLFFLAIKPQMTVGVVLWEVWEAIREKRLVRTFSPVSVALVASFLLYGLWPLKFLDRPTRIWNLSFWPLSIPVGLALMVYALRKRDIKYTLPASPCLSPYLVMHSWSVAALPVLSTPEFLAVFAGMWIVVLMLL